MYFRHPYALLVYNGPVHVCCLFLLLLVVFQRASVQIISGATTFVTLK